MFEIFQLARGQAEGVGLASHFPSTAGALPLGTHGILGLELRQCVTVAHALGQATLKLEFGRARGSRVSAGFRQSLVPKQISFDGARLAGLCAKNHPRRPTARPCRQILFFCRNPGFWHQVWQDARSSKTLSSVRFGPGDCGCGRVVRVLHSTWT